MTYIIMDRDGVINFDSDDYIKAPEEWIPIPGSLEAIAALTQAGYKVLVVTNQSGLARGFYTVETLDKIHHKMQQAVEAQGGKIEAIFYCPHHPDEHCECRKPNPGLFYAIQKKYDLDLRAVYYIGDKKTDVEAANAAGCKPILVLSGKGANVLKVYPELSAVLHFADLKTAVEFLMNNAEPRY